MNKVDYEKLGKSLEKSKKETDTHKQFQQSIENARAAGVPEKDILHNVDEIDDYFKS